MKDPIIRVTCTHELLIELHAAIDALVKSNRRTKKRAPEAYTPLALSSLVMQVSAARSKFAPPPVLTPIPGTDGPGSAE